MKTTLEFLDALKARHSVQSDYALAKMLGVTHQSASAWRKGRVFFDDSTAIQVGKLLEIDPAYVVACVHAERAKKDDEKAVWREIMEKFGGVAATVVIGIATATLAMPEASEGRLGFNDNIHYTYYIAHK